MKPSRVLIVDDEIDLAHLLKQYFIKRDFQVYVCQDLKGALSIYQEFKPDVLFLDNNLPDGYGWEIAPELAKKYPNTEIFLVSGYETRAPKMPEKSKFHVIEKPISYKQLDLLLDNRGASPRMEMI